MQGLCIINIVQLGVVVDFEYIVGKLIIRLLEFECLGAKKLKFFSIESSIAPLEFFLTENRTCTIQLFWN